MKIPLPGPVQRTLLAVLKSARIINDNERKRLSARTLRFPLGLETAPVIAVILCLATTTINGSTVRLGIKGDANIKPYDVLVLFISLVSWLNMGLEVLKLITPRSGLYLNSSRWHRCTRGGRFLGISTWRQLWETPVCIPLRFLPLGRLHSRQRSANPVRHSCEDTLKYTNSSLISWTVSRILDTAHRA